jgi:hypothetical protein
MAQKWLVKRGRQQICCVCACVNTSCPEILHYCLTYLAQVLAVVFVLLQDVLEQARIIPAGRLAGRNYLPYRISATQTKVKGQPL